MSEAGKAVFISYAHEDAEAARRIAEALRGFGMEVFFDENELRGGDSWDAKLRKQIHECTLFLPVISARANERHEGYFRREWRLAIERMHDMSEHVAFLVPVVIDETNEAVADVPDAFRSVQWTRLEGGEPTPEFVAQVKHLLDSPWQPVAGSGAGWSPTSGRAGESTRPENPPGGRVPPAVAGQRRSGIPTWIWVVAAVVTVAIGAAVWLNRDSGESSSQAPAASAKSIAVLPFDNRSELTQDQFFTDGIHDDLLTHISHIRGIKTISRTSVMGYRGTTKNMRTIGRELGVGTILEGGVQRAGNQVRINVQLIDATTDAHLWSEIYTRELTAENIFAIQSEISKAIAAALQAVLSPEEQEQLDKLPTQNLAALEAYFKGISASSLETSENIAEAIGHYQQAIELDPEFALAYARLARAYMVQIFNFSSSSAEDQIAKVQRLIDKAMEFDPHLSEAYDALGILRRYQLDFAGSEAAYQRAIELNPNNAIAYRGYSVVLRGTQADPEKALAMTRKAQELSPDNPDMRVHEAAILRQLGRVDEARTLLENLVRDYPDYARGYARLGWHYFDDFGLHDQAIVALRRAHALDPEYQYLWAPLFLVRTYERLGATEEEVFWLERALALAPENRFALRDRIRLLIIKGELAEADALWWREWEPSRNPTWAVNNSWELEDLMNAEFAVGRFAASRARYFKRFPDWFKPDAVIPGDFYSLRSVAHVARSLIATGERQQADTLLDQIIEKLEASPESTYTLYLRAIVPAIKGNHAEALRAIHRYVAFTGVPTDELYSAAEFEPLHSNPEFQAVFGDVLGKRQEQLANIRRMEANGELAPIPPLRENVKP